MWSNEGLRKERLGRREDRGGGRAAEGGITMEKKELPGNIFEILFNHNYH